MVSIGTLDEFAEIQSTKARKLLIMSVSGCSTSEDSWTRQLLVQTRLHQKYMNVNKCD